MQYLRDQGISKTAVNIDVVTVKILSTNPIFDGRDQKPILRVTVKMAMKFVFHCNYAALYYTSQPVDLDITEAKPLSFANPPVISV